LTPDWYFYPFFRWIGLERFAETKYFVATPFLILIKYYAGLPLEKES